MYSKKQRDQIRMYLKRTVDFRKWFAKIPKDQVDLDDILDLSEDAKKLAVKWATKNKIEVDVDDIYAGDCIVEEQRKFVVPVSCGSIGCVRGWAQYNYLRKLDYKDGADEYFGTADVASLYGDRLFDEEIETERYPSHKAEALARLDGRIMELKAMLT